MSDPNNKWNQPPAPPAPMFFGKKERDLVKQVNDELAERIIGQPIAYYPISIEESNFNDTYGEAIDKVSLPPVRVYAYVEVENEQTNERYGYEYLTKLTVNFNEKRLTKDQNLFVRVGDFIQYGDQFYEIVKTYNDTRYYFGQVEHKFQISTECIRARQGSFRVLPSIDRKPERGVVAGETTSPAPRVAPIPPLKATYVTVTPSSRLPNERVLTAGSGITLTDGGANSTITIASTGSGSAEPAGATTQVQYNNAGEFGASANLTYHSSTEALRISGTGPKLQFDETDAGAGKFQIATANGMLKWQVQNEDFDDASVKWVMNSSGNMAFRDGAAGSPIPARLYISGSGNSNLLQVSSSAAADILVVTGSGRVGIGTAEPTHTLTVDGALSASGNSFFAGDVTVCGTMLGCSPLKISGAVDIVNTVGTVVATLGSTMSASAASFTGFMVGAGFGNLTTINTPISIPSNYNSLLYGPITIDAGGELRIGAGSVIKIRDISDV